MCGISLIISGIHLDLSTLVTKSIDSSSQTQQSLLSIEDIEAALRRRGPDSLGIKRIFLQQNEGDLCIVETEVDVEKDLQDNSQINSVADLCFIGATLQLRGTSPIVQPLLDAFGNILVYNGEIFGGLYVGRERNDGEVLLESLRKCSCSHKDMGESKGCVTNGKSVVDILSMIKGPWALIYWQASSKTLWFGRDAFGRRSLLVHWPDPVDSRLLLSSVAPSWSCKYTNRSVEESEINFWEELPCGVYSMRMNAHSLDTKVTGQVKFHEWADATVHELIRWERTSIQPKPEDLIRVPTPIGQVEASAQLPSEIVLHVLREAVMRRSAITEIFKAPKKGCAREWRAPVGVLFSGGLDSMILAALLDDCLDPKYEIDLLNVSFDSGSAPDRISARAGVKELARVCPLRRWNLVEIDAELSKLTGEMKHVMTLINPSKTFMDINIGLALWFAAAGKGYIYDEEYPSHDCDDNGEKNYFKSDSRILLVGSGADEQCAGYGRHRTKYRNSSWSGLHKEMKLDMQRIWKRNLGRDDRCIADHGKEARFPFLDEDVIITLLKLPLWEIADLDQPSGKGDKKILREVAYLLGLHEASVLPKRAIQFGSRISRESNRKNFGSNRAANQASAGSAEVFSHSNRT